MSSDESASSTRSTPKRLGCCWPLLSDGAVQARSSALERKLVESFLLLEGEEEIPPAPHSSIKSMGVELPLPILCVTSLHPEAGSLSLSFILHSEVCWGWTRNFMDLQCKIFVVCFPCFSHPCPRIFILVYVTGGGGEYMCTNGKCYVSGEAYQAQHLGLYVTLGIL